MPSFSELQSQLKTLQFRKQVYMHVAEMMESEFLSDETGNAKKKLLTDEKQLVPEDVIDSFVNETLNEVKFMEEEIQKILSTQLGEKS